MADTKISEMTTLSAPSSQTAIPAIDPGTNAAVNYKLTRTELMTLLETMPLKQVVVSAGNSLALTVSAHNGATIILGGAGATLTINANNLGDGFACKIINDTGADWTVPSVTGGTRRYDASGHTKVLAGGSASLETFTRSGTRYLHISGTTA